MTSIAHENRTAVLTTLGFLAGCRSAVHLESALHPDVLLADHRKRWLFLGDAKASETAGCEATARRLRRYVRALSPWRAGGYGVRLAVCTPTDSGDWERSLAAVAQDAGTIPVASGTTLIGADTRLTWVQLATPHFTGARSTPVAEHGSRRPRARQHQ